MGQLWLEIYRAEVRPERMKPNYLALGYRLEMRLSKNMGVGVGHTVTVERD